MSLTVQIDVSRLDERTERLWRDGFLREAVRHEAELLLIRVADLAELPDLYGQPLIARALNERDSVLAITPRSTRTERDQHASAFFLALAILRGARNVYTHDVTTPVHPNEAAMWLAALQHVNGQLDQADSVAATEVGDGAAQHELVKEGRAPRE